MARKKQRFAGKVVLITGVGGGLQGADLLLAASNAHARTTLYVAQDVSTGPEPDFRHLRRSRMLAQEVQDALG